MKFRGAIILLAVLVLVIPAAGVGGGCTTQGNNGTDTVPVLYITGKDEYTFAFPADAPDESDLTEAVRNFVEEGDGEIVVLKATVRDTSICFDDTGVYGSIRDADAGCNGGGYSSGKGASLFPGGSILGMFAMPELRALLNRPDYYLVNLFAEPVFAPNTLPENNFVSPAPKDRYFRLAVPEGKEHLWVDLNWAGEEEGYRLTVYAPDAVMGPFMNADDGRIDDRIYLDISGSPYVKEGMWHYLVTNLNGGPSNFNFTNYY